MNALHTQGAVSSNVVWIALADEHAHSTLRRLRTGKVHMPAVSCGGWPALLPGRKQVQHCAVIARL